jgi:hypothetical protein
VHIEGLQQRIRQEDGETRVESGSNTSTVTLRVAGGDENGSLISETVRYGHESHPVVREGAPQKQDRNCQLLINIWS